MKPKALCAVLVLVPLLSCQENHVDTPDVGAESESPRSLSAAETELLVRAFQGGASAAVPAEDAPVRVVDPLFRAKQALSSGGDNGRALTPESLQKLSTIVGRIQEERSATMEQVQSVFSSVVDRKVVEGDYVPYVSTNTTKLRRTWLHHEIRELDDGSKVLVVIRAGEDRGLDGLATLPSEQKELAERELRSFFEAI